MAICEKDRQVLRRLAAAYARIAHLEVQQERMARYRQSNALEKVRPVVLIDEVPWGEIRDESLTNTCTPELGWLETHLRRTLYQWEHFQVDKVVPPVFQVGKRYYRRKGIGVEVKDRQIKGDTGAYIAAHAYTDQLKTDEDLNRLQDPEVFYDVNASEAALEAASSIFSGLMDVALYGCPGLQTNIWDTIATLRGVENLLLDLAERPEFMHRTAQRLMEIAQADFRQMETLGLLESDPVLLHCTPACTEELPASCKGGQVKIQHVWGRCSAQIFCSVSPEMHDAFDLVYNQELFKDCGLVYYGCCEPMDNKIDILRRRFKNLRKISITPWANPERAAANIGGDFVMAAKPNPAFVAMPQFNPEPVREEITRYCEACRSYGVTMEFVLKDISTIANRPNNLTQWADTVASVIDQYY